MNGSFETVAKLIKKMVSMHLDMRKTKILVMGIGILQDNEFYYDTDIIDIVNELKEYHIITHVIDPQADKEFLKQEYNIMCENAMRGFGVVSTYDAFILAINHDEFIYPSFDITEYWRGRYVIYDFKNFFPDQYNVIRP